MVQGKDLLLLYEGLVWPVTLDVCLCVPVGKCRFVFQSDHLSIEKLLMQTIEVRTHSKLQVQCVCLRGSVYVYEGVVMRECICL